MALHRRRNRRQLCAAEALETRTLLAGDLAITEFMADNRTTLHDEDGDPSDWIELENIGDAPINVGGWHLTDSPAQATKWTLPSKTLAPGERLVVFASGKNRTAATGELHTNFELAHADGYVGLFQPGGAVLAHAIAAYPYQPSDVSFGVAPQAVSTPVVDADSLATVLVPNQANQLPANWKSPAFNDSGWGTAPNGAHGPQGIGYAVDTGNLSYEDVVAADGPLRYYRFEESSVSSPAADEIGNAHGTYRGNVTVGHASGYSALGNAAQFSGTAGTFVELPLFHPGDTVTVEAWVNLSSAAPSTGYAAIVARWDGSYELDVNIGTGRANFVTKNTTDTFSLAESSADFTRSQWHHVVGIFDQGLTTIYVDGQQGTVADASDTGLALRNAGTELLIGATRAGDFRWHGLIDEVAIYNRALTVEEILEHRQVALGATAVSLEEAIQTDVEAQMHQRNASAAIRIPFELDRAADVDSLTFRAQFDDGFVAYLNGTEIARHHAPPGVPAWNATATGTRGNDQVLQHAAWDVTEFRSSLVDGTNVLAIHGLNMAPDDADFLISAQMVAERQGVVDVDLPGQYLDAPTPGASNTAGSPGVRDSAAVVINEFSARNDSYLDEDGDSSDWIELYNPLLYPVDLDGTYLTDDASDLTGWQFARGSIIPPRGYLVVFASGKDRTRGELHTDFAISGDGGYLAFVDSDGDTVISEYRNYPPQFSDVSYGIVNHVVTETVLDSSTEASVLVPTLASHVPANWTSPDFDDSGWQNHARGAFGPQPVGFGLQALPAPGPDPLVINPNLEFSDSMVLLETGHRIAYEGNPNGGTPTTAGLSNFALASNGAVPFATSSLSVSVLGPNRLNDGGYGEGGIGGGANPWVAGSADANGFVGIRFAEPHSINMVALGTRLEGRGDGTFTLQVTSDSFAGVNLSDRTQLEALTWSTLGTIDSTEPDEWERQLLGFTLQHNITGLRVLFEDPGTSIAEIEAYHAPVGAGVGTDVGPLMQHQTSTALIRLPFTVTDPAEIDQLLLDIQYDDGFVAYINGMEVARRGAPGTVTYNSVATAEHSANAIETIQVSAAAGLLRSGHHANVLAIHGLNLSASDSDFGVSARLQVQAVDNVKDVVRYFLDDSPGGPNGLGSDDRGPVIRDVTHGPNMPQPDENLVVTARIDPSGTSIGLVNLHYRTMYNAEVTVPMSDAGTGADAIAGDGVFSGLIPSFAFDAGQMVRYYITSFDAESNGTRWPMLYDLDGQDQSPLYLGTVVADPDVTSQMPRLHWFVQNPVPTTDGITEWSSRASLFFDGEFYDNVFVRIRGASSRNEEKKPFKFDFSEGHYFRYSDDAPRVEEINLNATFQDKAYLREPLSYEVLRRAGVPAPDSQSVRVELNGEFFSVASLTQQIDDIFLEQNGLDPEGALYKMFNGITSASGGVEKKTRLDEGNNDLAALVAGLSAANPNRKQYVFDNIDLPAAINYMVSGIIVQDFDRGAKNYYVYRDTNGSGEWTQIPWDQDLTLGNRFYSDEIAGDGSGGHGMHSHPFWGESQHNLFGTNMMIDAIIDIPETREMYLRRLRTLMDEILQSSETPVAERYFENRLDELSAILADDAAEDLAKWGAIYGVVRDFQTAVELIRTNYLDQRRVYLFDTHNIRNLGGGSGIVSTLVPEFAPDARYFVPTDNSLGVTWTNVAPPTNLSQWGTGTLGIGYETTPADYAPLIRTTVNPTTACPTCTTVMVRVPFQIDSQAAIDSIQTNGLTLRMKYDDGFVAYLNGHEVARRGITGTVNFNSVATNHDDVAAVNFEEINITNFANRLVVGDNVLAIQVVNQAATSSDLLLLPALVEGIVTPSIGVIAGIPDAQPDEPVIQFDPVDFDANPASGNQDEEYLRLNNPNPTPIDISGWRVTGGVQHTFKPGTVIPAGGSLFVSPNVVAFRARATGPSGGQSLFVQGPYQGQLSSFGETVQLMAPDGRVVDSLELPEEPSDVQRFLRVSEVHYNPAGDGDTEFLELTNISSGTNAVVLDLAGVTWNDGPSEPFTVPDGVMLAPGQYVLVVQDLAAFRQAYPSVPTSKILGEYMGSLANGGERIQWDDATGSTIVDFEYGDGGLWARRADGTGASLELVDVTSDTSQMDEPASWQGSFAFGGTPGQPNSTPLGVVVNEVLTNSATIDDTPDSVELLNVSDRPVDISGWALSDSDNNLLKFIIPTGTVLEPGAYIVFDEQDFNPNPSDPAPDHFALNGTEGDDLWVVVPNGSGGVLAFVDDVEFDASPFGVSWGRVPNGSGPLALQSLATIGCENRFARVSDLVVTEVQYNPGEPSSAALQVDPNLIANQLEYIELLNHSDEPLDLHGWRVRGGIDLDMEPGTTLAPGEVGLVVPFDPAQGNTAAAFRAHYGIGDNVRLIGTYTGQLSNGGDRIRIQRPNSAVIGDPSLVPHITIDEVIYDDLGDWPQQADGTGASLARRALTAHGNSPASWAALPASPGTVVSGMPGDMDGSGVITAADIDQLADAIVAGFQLSSLDLNQDGDVNPADRAFLVSNILNTLPGDANLDGVVDGLDFNRWNAHKFIRCAAGWGEGDFNGDAVVDASDFNLWFSHRFQSAAPKEAAAARAPRSPLAHPEIIAPSTDDLPTRKSMSSGIRHNIVSVEVNDGTGGRVDFTSPTAYQRRDIVFPSSADLDTGRGTPESAMLIELTHSRKQWSNLVRRSGASKLDMLDTGGTGRASGTLGMLDTGGTGKASGTLGMLDVGGTGKASGTLGRLDVGGTGRASGTLGVDHVNLEDVRDAVLAQWSWSKR